MGNPKSITFNYKILRIVYFVFAVIILSSCINQSYEAEPAFQPIGKTVTSLVEIQETTPPVIELTSTIEAENTNKSHEDLVHTTKYKISINFNYRNHSLTVLEEIRYQNKTGSNLDQFPLVVLPNLTKDTFFLIGIQGDQKAKIEKFVLSDEILTVEFQNTVQPGEIIELVLQYELQLPNVQGVFGYTEAQTNLSYWYAYVPPYNSETGWTIHPSAEFGEYVVSEKSDFYIEIALSGDTKPVIAAPGREERDTGIIEFIHLNARDFSWSASPYYNVLTQQFGHTTVNGFVLNGETNASKSVLTNSGYALQYFGELFAFQYPHDTFIFIEADFKDGMEFDGLYFLSNEYFKRYDDTNRNYLTAIAVHETAHQWFYGVVGNDQALEPWLDEALCTFSELLFYEFYFPTDVAWWWNERVYAYEPAGWVDSTIYEHTTLRSYINAVYLKGALFFFDLRQFAGNEQFTQMIKDYVLENKDSIVSNKVFFKLLDPIDWIEIKEIYFSK